MRLCIHTDSQAVFTHEIKIWEPERNEKLGWHFEITRTQVWIPMMLQPSVSKESKVDLPRTVRGMGLLSHLSISMTLISYGSLCLPCLQYRSNVWTLLVIQRFYYILTIFCVVEQYWRHKIIKYGIMWSTKTKYLIHWKNLLSHVICFLVNSWGRPQLRCVQLCL